MEQIKLGDVARDSVTGMEGVVVARTVWLNNCDRMVIQPEGENDGKPIDACGFDLPNLEFVKHTDHKVWPVTRPDPPVEIGDLAQDRITNLKVIVLARTTWMNGCSRMTCQSRELVKGKPADSCMFDETDLVIIEKSALAPKPASKAVEAEGQRSGGPKPTPTRR